MDSDEEAYVLLLLADSNLPTGSFVASSGLESCLTHGFSSRADFIISFVTDSVQTYAHGALPFVSDTHRVVTGLCVEEDTVQRVLGDLTVLDEHYHAMTLNHIARRASQSQGVALLSLFAKGFSRPAFIPAPKSVDDRDRESRLNSLVDMFKAMARKGDTHSHLPICWGILTAALRLRLGENSPPTLHHLTDLQSDHSTFTCSCMREASSPPRSA
jgi:urease accessory protein